MNKVIFLISFLVSSHLICFSQNTQEKLVVLDQPETISVTRYCDTDNYLTVLEGFFDDKNFLIRYEFRTDMVRKQYPLTLGFSSRILALQLGDDGKMSVKINDEDVYELGANYKLETWYKVEMNYCKEQLEVSINDMVLLKKDAVVFRNNWSEFDYYLGSREMTNRICFDGDLRNIAVFNTASKEKLEKLFWPDGSIQAIGPLDENNLKTGTWKIYYETGELEMEGLFLDDQPTGDWRRYYKNGTLQSISAALKGVPHGKTQEFWPNGQLKLSSEFSAGQKVGVWKTYYERNGNLWQVEQFKEGVVHGQYLLYYENGNLREDGTYNLGIKEGLWKFYDTQGLLLRKGEFKNGLEEGVWTFYDVNGNIEKTLIYERGQIQY